MHIFLFLYIRRHFIHNTSFLFIMILVHAIFRTTFLKMKKILHDSGISTNTIDNNETSTNVMTQTICMHKTKVNQHETNVSPLVKQK